MKIDDLDKAVSLARELKQTRERIAEIDRQRGNSDELCTIVTIDRMTMMVSGDRAHDKLLDTLKEIVEAEARAIKSQLMSLSVYE